MEEGSSPDSERKGTARLLVPQIRQEDAATLEQPRSRTQLRSSTMEVDAAEDSAPMEVHAPDPSAMGVKATDPASSDPVPSEERTGGTACPRLSVADEFQAEDFVEGLEREGRWSGVEEPVAARGGWDLGRPAMGTMWRRFGGREMSLGDRVHRNI